MGYSKLAFEDMGEHPEVWLGEHSLTFPNWAQELSALGHKGVWAVDFYEDLFGGHLEPSRIPEDYQTGEYGAIVLEILRDVQSKKKAKRFTVTDGCMELFNLIDESENFVLLSPVAYAGKNRTNENARYLFALCVEIDDINPKNGINEMFYAFERINRPVPHPTYIVCSGNGLHLYYVFERPIPLFKNIYLQLSEAKKYVTTQLWSAQISNSHDKIQYEPLTQGFRAVGTFGKDKNKVALAFEVGPKLSIEDFNARLPKKYAINVIYKSNLTRQQAKELYPKWYQKVVVEKNKEKGHWNRHEGIYYNWIEKCHQYTKVNHRYRCLENLCSLAVQCQIPPEQVEKDVRELANYFETLTIEEDNHFTEYDILCAMRTYENPTDGAYRRKLEFISERTNIPLTRTDRNGRKRKEHLQADILMRADGKPQANSCKQNREVMLQYMRENGLITGRPKKSEIVKEWRQANPNGRKSDCVKDTGLDKKTVYKWWNVGGNTEEVVEISNRLLKQNKEAYDKLSEPTKKSMN